MELTDPVLLGFWDDRSGFVDQLLVKLCQCPEKESEEVEGEVITKRHASNHLGQIFCGFIWSKPQMTSKLLIKLSPAI